MAARFHPRALPGLADTAPQDPLIGEPIQKLALGRTGDRHEAGDRAAPPVTDGDARPIGDTSKVGAQSRSELTNADGRLRFHVITVSARS